MARTIQTIYDAIITEKETFASLDGLVPNPDQSQTFLADLTSGSKVAIWRLLFWVFAVAIYVHEQIFDLHQAQVDEDIANKTFGQLPWYNSTSEAFQNGYELTWNNAAQVYEYTDTTSQAALDSQIITQAAASILDTGTGYQIILKVAKGTIGSLSALSSSEIISYTSYIDKVKPAGTNTAIISTAADDIRISITITFDPLIIEMDGSTPQRGVLISDGSTYPAEVAVTNYIQNIDFDSFFKVMDLVDALQAADGVLNVSVQHCDARYGVTDYIDIMEVPEQVYNANAGYLAMASGNGLNEYYPIAYDTGTIYNAGQWVLESGTYYECKCDGATGAFTPADWDAITNDKAASITYIAG